MNYSYLIGIPYFGATILIAAAISLLLMALNTLR